MTFLRGRSWRICGWLALGGVLYLGCPGPEVEEEPTDTPAPSFSADVKAVLAPCVECHRDGAGGWWYDGGANAYAAVVTQLDLDQPPQSPLLTKATGVDHKGGAAFTSDSQEYATLLSWIEAGAPDN